MTPARRPMSPHRGAAKPATDVATQGAAGSDDDDRDPMLAALFEHLLRSEFLAGSFHGRCFAGALPPDWDGKLPALTLRRERCDLFDSGAGANGVARIDVSVYDLDDAPHMQLPIGFRLNYVCGYKSFSGMILHKADMVAGTYSSRRDPNGKWIRATRAIDVTYATA